MAPPTRPPADLLEVGRIDRAHGLKGEVVVSLVTNRTERLQAGSELHAVGGVLTVRRSRPLAHRWVVAFEGVTDRSAAEPLRGAVLSATPLVDADELWVHELIGAEVTSTDGLSRGTVLAVQANPASDLLVMDTGALVPLTFVVSAGTTDDGPPRVVVEAPAGLFDLA